MRTRFVKSPEEVSRLQAILAAPSFLSSRSLSLTFLTDPSILAELLPPPLKPPEEARVSIAVYEIGRSNCVGAFDGASVNLACTYRGEPGLYCLAMPMSTDTAVIFGRELYAEPKKIAECRLRERGKIVTGTVTRHGISFMELTGTFEQPLAPAGRESISHHYYFKYLPAANGRGLAHDPELIRVTHRGVTHLLTRGDGKITFRESAHDPIIDLPVWQVEGAAFSEGETHTTAEVVQTVPAEEFLPWAYGKMDDLTVWAGAGALTPA